MDADMAPAGTAGAAFAAGYDPTTTPVAISLLRASPSPPGLVLERSPDGAAANEPWGSLPPSWGVSGDRYGISPL